MQLPPQTPSCSPSTSRSPLYQLLIWLSSYLTVFKDICHVHLATGSLERKRREEQFREIDNSMNNTCICMEISVQLSPPGPLLCSVPLSACPSLCGCSPSAALLTVSAVCTQPRGRPAAPAVPAGWAARSSWPLWHTCLCFSGQNISIYGFKIAETEGKTDLFFFSLICTFQSCSYPFRRTGLFCRSQDFLLISHYVST